MKEVADRIKYLDFKLSKLLKEYGYNDVCNSYYSISLTKRKDEQDGYGGPFGWKKGELDYESRFFINNYPDIDRSNKNWYYCARPTYDMVLDWFLDVHNLNIFAVKQQNGSFKCTVQGMDNLKLKSFPTKYEAINDTIIKILKNGN